MNPLKKTLLSLCGLFVFFGYCQSRQKKIDSLEVLLNTSKNDSINTTRQIQLGILTYVSNPNKSTQYLKQALKNLNAKYPYADKAKSIAVVYDYLAVIERRKNNYDTALNYHIKSLKIRKQLNDSLLIGKSYHDFAKLFSAKREYDKAIYYIKKALPLCKTDSIKYGGALRNYGKFLYLKKEYTNALKLLDSAALFFKKNPLNLADVNTIYSKIYRTQNKLNLSLHLLKENLNLYSKLEEMERKANIFIDMAIIYRKQKKYSTALAYLDSAETYHKKNKNKKVVSNIFYERYQIFIQQKNHKKALNNYVTYKKYSDSVFTTEKIQKVTQLEINYENDKKEAIAKVTYAANKKQLEEVVKTQRVQKQLYAILLLLSILGIITLVIIYRNKQRINAEKMQKVELETALLNEKTVFLQYKINRLLADHNMQSDFKDGLIKNIKSLKNKSSTKALINEYQSILIQLENQVKTETRTTKISGASTLKDDVGFELKLAETYPQLTKSEREMCQFIFLNLSLKEIMNIKNTTLPSVKSTRYRIRKKMEVPKTIDLELFVQNLFK